MAETHEKPGRHEADDGKMVEHVTKDGTRYRLAVGRFQELVSSLRASPTRGMWLGALLPVAVGLVSVAVQVTVAGGGLQPGFTELHGWALWSALWADRAGNWVTHLFLQPHPIALFLNLFLLASFGIALGWREGAWRVGLPLVMAGLSGGGAACLVTGAGQIGLWYGIVGVVTLAMWRMPTGRVRESFVPTKMIAGLLVLAVVPRVIPGGVEPAPDLLFGLDAGGRLAGPSAALAAPVSSFGPLLAASAAALLTGVFLLPRKEIDCGRVGAVATFVAVAFGIRLADRVFAVVQDTGMLLSATNWLGIVFDLLVLVIACIYTMSQAEMLADMRFWEVRDRLDALVAGEGERVEG